jgi:hypothetical protein
MYNLIHFEDGHVLSRILDPEDYLFWQATSWKYFCLEFDFLNLRDLSQLTCTILFTLKMVMYCHESWILRTTYFGRPLLGNIMYLETDPVQFK